MTSARGGDGALDYRGAGVDIDAAEAAKRRIRSLVESTYTDGVRGAFGAFGGMFRAPAGPGELLVASADGVGTKVKLAIAAGRHDTVGHDLVNHCVNDVLVQGARPLFFLDYVAFGSLVPEVVEQVVAGVAAGCRENGCALLGGETAEMPGVYTPPDYDLAGFIVGVAREDRVPGPHAVRSGDVLVALASSGPHTNGYSLARRILAERMQLGPHDEFAGTGRTVAELFLAIHRSYLAVLFPVLEHVHALAHITGGGIPGNLARAIPPDLDATVERSTWTVPEPFASLQVAGAVPLEDMERTFNMGVGMIAICDPGAARYVIEGAARGGIPAWVAGSVGPGSGRVRLV